jgi:hypothetical protein
VLLQRKILESWQILSEDLNALDRNAVLGSFPGNTRIAWSAPYLLGVRRLRQFPHQGVFPATRPNHQNSHAPKFKQGFEYWNSSNLKQARGARSHGIPSPLWNSQKAGHLGSLV